MRKRVRIKKEQESINLMDGVVGIRIGTEYSCEKDKYQWQLHRWYLGEDKDKNTKLYKTTTFHGTIEQVCKAVLNRDAGMCDSVEEILDTLSKTADVLKEYINHQAKLDE